MVVDAGSGMLGAGQLGYGLGWVLAPLRFPGHADAADGARGATTPADKAVRVQLPTPAREASAQATKLAKMRRDQGMSGGVLARMGLRLGLCGINCA